MRARLVATQLALLAGCDSPMAPTEDAPGAETLTARVLAPDGGEVIYPAEPFTVRWSGEDSAGGVVRYDVELVDASDTARALGSALELPSGQVGELTWTPIGVQAPTQYRIRLKATSERGGVASDDSDAAFTVSPPAQGTSFARDLQPIFTARCTTQFCHDTASQVAVLHLATGASYDQLVDVPSRETPCTSYMRVLPGAPDQSYLVFKLQGSGSCYSGVRMPKDAAALTTAQITMVRDWIAAGAHNN